MDAQGFGDVLSQTPMNTSYSYMMVHLPTITPLILIKKLPPCSPLLNTVEQGVSALKGSNLGRHQPPTSATSNEQSRRSKAARNCTRLSSNLVESYFSCYFKPYSGILAQLPRLNVGSGFALCKHTCHVVLTVIK